MLSPLELPREDSKLASAGPERAHRIRNRKRGVAPRERADAMGGSRNTAGAPWTRRRQDGRYQRRLEMSMGIGCPTPKSAHTVAAAASEPAPVRIPAANRKLCSIGGPSVYLTGQGGRGYPSNYCPSLELLGHKDVKATMICTHVLNRVG